ncbi:MAG: TAXI family TRAP transporter solute-binding subunit [Chloroflexi bacterium]|nr:TAXI family TRAP transporter solute-binding subunit [Chloroflexota bacterium]
MFGRASTLWILSSFLVVAVLAFACAPAAAPTPTPAPKPPAEKAAAPTPAPAKPATEKAAAPTPAPAKPTPAAKAAAPTPAPAKVTLPGTINLATHAVGSAYNAAGTAVAKLLTDKGPMRVVVQPFAGPPGWIPGLHGEGKPEVGMVNVVEAWQAFAGKVAPGPLPEGVDVKPPYNQAYSRMRALAYGGNMYVGMAARAATQYRTVGEVKGLRWTWGFPAFPANAMTTAAALALAGLTPNDIQKVNVPEATAAQQAIVDGRVDAVAAAVGMGSVAEADAKVGLRFLDQTPVSASALKNAQALMPGGDVITVKKGPAGVREDTPIWGYGMVFVASTYMSDDTAYTLVKSFWDNNETIRPMHQILLEWTHERFVYGKATLPFHPGAIKFYKEKGVWTKEADQMQEALLKAELPFLK